jgi:PAS domain S-box-containing protein
MATTKDSIHVLHVDDDPGFAELAADMMAREDDRITVETATSASEGLDRVTAEHFDCIVSDYNMPGQDGIEFLETIREEYPDLPFILYTGKGSEEVASDAISAGATDYLQKGTGTDQYELLANRIQNAVEQFRAQQWAGELERLRALVKDINQALVRANSRSDIETQVCEIISESDPYLFVWIGEADAETDRVEPRAWAGVEDGYLDDITVTADETATGRGLTGTAIRERQIAVSQNLQESAEYEPWRESARDRGYQSSAAVPLEYKDTLYGALNVYADRPNAFDNDEQDVLTELADDIGHAIYAAEVKDDLQRARQRAEQYFETAGNIMVVLNTDGTVARVNERGCDLLGYERSELVGSDWFDLAVPETIQGEITDVFSAFWSEDKATIQTNVNAIETKDGEQIIVEWHTTALRDQEGDVTVVLSSGSDITERKDREQNLTALHDVADDLTTSTSVEEVCERTIDAAEEVLNLDISLVAIEEDEFLQVRAASGEISPEDYEAMHVSEGLAGKTFRTGQAYVVDEASTHEIADPQGDFESALSLPVGEHGNLQAVAEERNAFDEDDLELAELLVSHTRTVLDRLQRESALTALHDAAARLETTTSETDIYDIVIDTAEDILEFDFVNVDVVADDRLEVQASSSGGTDGYQSVPLDADDNLGVRAYQQKETIVENDLRNVAVTPADPELRSALTVPIGRFGAFQAGSRSADAFDETDWELAELLVNHTREALQRLKQERSLREQRDRLRRENERLNQFASIVSHDLRNPLTVASGELELARTERDSEHLDEVAISLDRMEAIIEDVLAMARSGQAVEDSDLDRVDLADLARECWRTVDTADADLEVTMEATVRADRDRLRRALENLFRNAIEHGGGGVTITIGDRDDGFYVADEGTGIPPDDRDSIFEFGYTTNDDGTGFGLAIVKGIVAAHGWSIDLVESEDGGARFEIVGVNTTTTAG